MLQHATNCHGEWNLLLAIVSAMPFVGVCIKMALSRHKGDNHDKE